MSERIKVLIVEDVKVLLDAMLEHLVDMFPNWEFVGVLTVGRALDVLEVFDPDVLLLDYMLVNGTIEVVLKKTEQPVVLATGYVDRNRFETLAGLYRDRLIYLPKPYDRESLRQSLLKALALKEAKTSR